MHITRVPIHNSTLADALTRANRPNSISFELTARCTNNCSHCYINVPAEDGDARDRELSFAEVEDLAGQAVAEGALWCLLSGGEPLLREDFADIYLMLKRKGLLISVFTNGCLITRDHVDLFSTYPPRELEISVYGATEQTYERLSRIKGSYAQFRRGLDLLLDHQVPVSLKGVAVRSTLHEIDQIERFCTKYSRSPFRFDPFLHLRYDGDKKRNQMIVRERLTADEIVMVEQGNRECRLALEKTCRSLATEEQVQHRDNLFSCGILAGSYEINPDGVLRLCGALNHPAYVRDLRTMPLARAYEEIAATIINARSANQEFITQCNNCRISDLCFLCPATVYLETGRLDTRVSSFCKTAHARAGGAVP